MFGTRQKYLKMEGEPGGGDSAPPAGGTPPAGGDAWYNGFKDEEVKGWLGAMNGAYPDAESVAAKAYNLEKFLGADKAGRGIVMPKPDAKPEEWREFYTKVGGVPESPDGYKLPDTMVSDPVAAKFREHAHKSGMPPMFFESAINWYTEFKSDTEKQMLAEFQANSDKEFEELKQEWQGVEYDKNIELGRRAAKQFLPHENADDLANMITRMEGAMGTKATMKFLANIGAAIGEHAFESGEGSGGMGGMSKEAARVRIDMLKKDSEWQAKWAKGDAQAKAEWDSLHKIAFG